MILRKDNYSHYANDNYEGYNEEVDFSASDLYEDFDNEEFDRPDDSKKHEITDETLKETIAEKTPQKKHYSTIIKKKKKPAYTFNIGDTVIYKKSKAYVLVGPYEKNYKQVYEVQMENGSLVTASATALKRV